MKTTKMLAISVLALAIIVCLARVSEAGPMGTAFTYQGRLIDANIAADGEYDFQFKLYDANTAGAQKGSDVNQPDVDVIDGYFTVELDFGAGVFDSNARWLQIGVRPGDMNDPNVYTALNPRQEITPTPYALQTRGIFVDDTGNVGIGTTTPSYQLHVVDTAPNSDAPAIYGEHAVMDYYGIGIKGVGLYKGVEGRVSASGSSIYYGVSGLAGTGSGAGTAYGVYGYASGAATSYGVYGKNDNNGYGVYGKNNTSGNYGYLGDPNYGVYGKNESSGNYGYLGDPNYGVYGRSYGGKIGVYGKSGGNTSGNYGHLGDPNYGVYGHSGSAWGGRYGYLGGSYGAYGKNDYTGNYGYLGGGSYGVYGERPFTGSYGYLGGYYGVYGYARYSGVYGENSNGNYGYLGGSAKAVVGSNSNGSYGYLGGNYGVYGQSSNYAGYFAGNVYVTGYISADAVYDRTPYPKDLATAYQAVMSMEKLPDGQYEENNKENQLDHSKLSDFIKSKDGNRDLSATVSCLNEVVKDLIKKVEDQQRLIEIQNAQIRQMLNTLQTNKQQPQISITKGAVR